MPKKKLHNYEQVFGITGLVLSMLVIDKLNQLNNRCTLMKFYFWSHCFFNQLYQAFSNNRVEIYAILYNQDG